MTAVALRGTSKYDGSRFAEGNAADIPNDSAGIHEVAVALADLAAARVRRTSMATKLASESGSERVCIDGIAMGKETLVHEDESNITLS